jgi:protein-L-isoaspartate(D-aspartate) O-methyltransferase
MEERPLPGDLPPAAHSRPSSRPPPSPTLDAARPSPQAEVGGDALAAWGCQIDKAHQKLLREIAEDAVETAHWTHRRGFSPRVMSALADVPRHLFVPEHMRDVAYDNRPLPIGFGQTISQPFIVAVMTDLLDLAPDDRVLEIGSGSGYQTAVLAHLADTVYSVELVPELAATAAEILARLGCDNVRMRQGDGYAGWPEAAPFDAAIVTAAPPDIPPALVDQLRTGGRLVVPIGEAGETQFLYRCLKRPDGILEKSCMLPVAFVPMLPAH